jgi:TIR domain
MELAAFLSHSHKDSARVRQLRGLLQEIFPEVAFFLDTDIAAGDRWRERIEAQILKSGLFLLFLSRESLLSREVHSEWELARLHGVQILPIKIDPEITDAHLFRDDLDKLQYADLSEGKFEGLSKVVHEFHNRLAGWFSGEVKVLQRLDDLVDHLVDHTAKRLDIFLIQGGTTLRALLTEGGTARLARRATEQNPIRVRFLYLDTNCYDSLTKTVAARANPVFASVTPEQCMAVYEAILQASMGLHNHGPHWKDLEDSMALLAEWKERSGAKVEIEVRKTARLPFRRMIVADDFAYATHFLIQPGEITRRDYFSLCFKRETQIYEESSRYFERLFQAAEVVSSSAIPKQ